MTFPSFLIIGAARSGTTSCYNYLQEHPDVYMSPVKEARFFTYEGETVDFNGPADRYTINRNTVTDADRYAKLFAGRTTERVTGEASPIYLYDPRTASNIERHRPDCKLICILRNPIERAYSDFLNMVRHGWEPLRDFERALHEEEDRKRRNWGPFYHYASKGYYGEQIDRYIQRFSKDQLHVVRFEAFRQDPTAVMQGIYRFLDIDPDFQPSIERKHNQSGLPKIELLHTLVTHPVAEAAFRGPLRALRQNLRDLNTNNVKPPMSSEVWTRMADMYDEDRRRLASLLGWDLTDWFGAAPKDRITSRP